MNTLNKAVRNVALFALSACLLSACATSSKVPSDVVDVRNKLMRLQADPQLAKRGRAI